MTVTPVIGNSAGGTTTATTAAFNVNAGDLLIVYQCGRKNTTAPGQPTCTDSQGFTNTNLVIGSAPTFAADPRLRQRCVWRRIATGGSITVTTTFADSASCALVCIVVPAADEDFTNFVGGNSTSGSPSVTLPSGPAATSCVVSFVCCAGTSAIGTPSGFTQLYEGTLGSNLRTKAIYDNTAPGSGVTWSSANGNSAVSFFEIKQGIEAAAANVLPVATSAAAVTTTAPPSITATAANAIPALTSAAAVTNTLPPSISTSAANALQPPTSTAAVTVTAPPSISTSAANALLAPSSASAVTVTAPPAVSATAANALKPLTSAAAVTVTAPPSISASSATAIPVPTSASATTVTAPPSISVTAGNSLPAASSAAAVTVTAPGGVSASSASSLPAATSAAAVTVTAAADTPVVIVAVGCGTASATSSGFTPAVGDLIVITAGAYRSGAVPGALTVTDSTGLTYGGAQLVSSQAYDNASDPDTRQVVYARPAPDPPALMAVDLSVAGGAASGCAVAVALVHIGEFASPWNVGTDNSVAGDPAPTLPVAGSAGSFAVATAYAPGTADFSTPAGFTEIFDAALCGQRIAIDFAEASAGDPYAWSADSEALPAGMTLTRASEASYWSGGLIVFAAANTPRFEDLAGGGKGLLLEGSFTNHSQYSEAYDNAYWNGSGVTVTANVATAPDGQMTADQLAVSGAGMAYWHYVVTPSAVAVPGDKVVASVFAKAGLTGAATHARLQSTNGVYAPSGSEAKAAMTSQWQRLTLPAWVQTGSSLTDSSVGNLSVANVPDADATGNTLFWGHNLGKGDFTTSYVRATGSTATRAADSLSRSVTLPSGGFTEVIEFVTGQGLAGVQTIEHFTGTNAIKLFIQADTLKISTTGGFDLSIAALMAPNTRYRLAFSISATRRAASLNGAAVVTSAGTAGVTATQQALGGEVGGGNDFNGYLVECNASQTVWRGPSSDAELQALSAGTGSSLPGTASFVSTNPNSWGVIFEVRESVATLAAANLLPAATSQSAVTNTPPPAISASATNVLPVASSAAAVTVTAPLGISLSAANTLPAATSAAAVTSTPPAISAAATNVLPPATSASAVTVTAAAAVSAAAANTLPVASSAAAVTTTLPPAVSATSAVVLPAATSAASVLATAPGEIAAVSAVTLPVPRSAAAVTVAAPIDLGVIRWRFIAVPIKVGV